MKRNSLKFIVLAFMFIAICFPFGNFKKAKAEENYILISPTAITYHDNAIFVADETSGKILKYSNSSTPSSQGVQPLASIDLTDTVKIVTGENGLIALSQTATTSKLYLIDFNLSTKTEITFESEYSHSLSLVTDIAVNGSNFYALRDYGDIDQFTFLTETKLSSPVTYDKQNYLNNENVQIIKMDIVNGNFSLKTKNETRTLLIPSLEISEPVTLSGSETFIFSSNKYAITSTGRVIDVSVAETTIANFSGSPSGFCMTEDKIFITDKSTHKIYKLDLNSPQKEFIDLQINSEIDLQYLSPENFIQIKLRAETPLFCKPYSVSPTMTCRVHTNLNVIATYNNFYYCLVVENGKNHFLYLNKTDANYEVIEVGSSDTIYTATRTCKIYSLPSTTMNGNRTIATINPSQEISVLSATTINNSNGELFYLTKYNGEYGFIRSTFLQSTRGTVELTTPCNAKTKRQTTLFETADGSGTILSLEKGTRIALLEETSPTKQYVLAEYQDTKGVVYRGYILAEDVSNDGLSTLQILGLVLVGTNILLLTIIIIIKKRSKKWKVAPTTDDIPVIK